MASSKPRTKKVESEHIPEIVTFSMYTLLGILAFFVVIEMAVIGFWFTLSPDNQQIEVKKQDNLSIKHTNSRLQLEVEYRKELRQIKTIYEKSGADSGLVVHKELRNKLAEMHVPPAYRYYHLSLVVLLDEIIAAEIKDSSNYNFVEKERQLSLLMNKYQ